ncbi:MAG: MBL fold metallo-hydrolase [Actinomycetota bacterium]|nr:MBL fold metallo-hydrolase [Actinomycetota bacterium]
MRSISKGVWLLVGGRPIATMNVYFLEEEGGGVTMFDAGVKSMTRQIRASSDELGGLQRIVLGHGHPDHRGAAAGLDAPVFCHPDNVADTQGDGGISNMQLSRLPFHGRLAYPLLLKAWDGGPVRVAGTVAEGDEVAGFKVVNIAGHAPGQIALFREKDGLALTSDCFYTIDPLTGFKGPPRLPHAAFNLEQEKTRAAVRRLADLEPAVAWPGHAEPVTTDVRKSLVQLVD